MSTTALDDRTLRRALLIQGRAYTLALDESGFKLTQRGRRLGLEIRWDDLVSGEAALATALNASLIAPLDDDKKPRSTAGAKRRPAARRRRSR